MYSKQSLLISAWYYSQPRLIMRRTVKLIRNGPEETVTVGAHLFDDQIVILELLPEVLILLL